MTSPDEDSIRFYWSDQHQTMACAKCGSLIADTDRHREWHAALDGSLPLFYLDNRAIDFGSSIDGSTP